MRQKYTWILTLFLVSFVQFSFAQQKEVSGVVTSKDYGDPIPGASVMIEGTQRGIDTDENGIYKLVVKPGDVVVVEFLGFKKAKATVGTSNILNFALIEDQEQGMLDEVVVDAYRTMAKPKSNVAASTVTSKTIEGRPNAALMQTLQGQVPGLNISTGSGQPGSNSRVILRGLGSINGQTEPLYIIDGVPAASERFRSLNPNDFESVVVLKDAGATSIYGNRGANGVIVITTKKGSFESPLEIKYVGTTGISMLQGDDYNMMNGSEYLLFSNKLAGRTIYTKDQIANAHTEDWVNVFFRTALAQTHTLSFSSGGKNLSSFTSVGYSNFEGILKKTDLQRFNFRNNLTGKNTDGKLTFSVNTSVNYSKNNLVSGTGSNGVAQNMFYGAYSSLPFLNKNDYSSDYPGLLNLVGKYGLGSTPFLLLNKQEYNRFFQNEIKLLLNGDLNYKISNQLSAGTRIGLDYQKIDQVETDNPASFLSNFSKPNDQQYRGRFSSIYEERAVINSTSHISWNNIFKDKHEFKAAAFIEYLKAHYKNQTLSREGFDPLFYTPGITTGAIPDTSENDFYVANGALTKATSGLFSVFGTFDYDYDTKYGIGATIRRDASFRFVDENKWGTFWSLSGRWNISNEKFLAGSIFNDLKLRGSYGTTGNQDITGSGYFGGYNLFSPIYSSVAGYYGDPGLAITQFPNRDLRWETITQSNIGLDFAILNNRLRGSVDVYDKTTSDLYQSVPLSSITGATSINANYGTLQNRGIELILAGDVIRTENTRLTLNVNGSYNENIIKDLPTETGIVWNGESSIGLKEGGPLYQFILFKPAGIDKNTGEYLFYDKDGNIKDGNDPNDPLKAEDRVWTNKSSIPRYQGAFGIDFEHKGFFASANFTFVADVWRWDSDYLGYTNPSNHDKFNLSKDLFDFWTPDNKDAKFASPQAKNSAFRFDSSDVLTDASYVRLRYLTVGYNFKQKDLSTLKLSGLRVYFQAENLYTWSKWRGWDAESSRIGGDSKQYPTPKTITFGVEVKF